MFPFKKPARKRTVRMCHSSVENPKQKAPATVIARPKSTTGRIPTLSETYPQANDERNCPNMNADATQPE